MKRFTVALVLLSFVAACGGDDGGTTVVTPAGMVIVSGNNQTGTVGTALSSQVTVRVVDDANNGMSGVNVSFSASDGSVSPSSGTTDAQGQASTTWTLGTTAGTQSASASASGVSANFSATAEAGPPADVAVSGDNDRIVWGRTLQLSGEVVDEYGNPVTGEAIAWSSEDETVATVDAGSGLVTGAGLGTVNIVGTAGTATGSYAVSVTPIPGASLTRGSDSGCLLDETGAAFCWGQNYNGQLGDGTNTFSSTPVAVAGGLHFVALGRSNQSHHCGLTDTGQAYCWGQNGNGELGDGTTNSSNVPVAVAGGHTFRSIGQGYYHTCGLTDGNAAYCWGDNFYGQLGDGTSTDRLTPNAVSTTLTFDTLVVGGVTSCVLDGTQAYCWGYNFNGEAGDGTTATPRTTPVTVAGGHAFSTLSAGGQHGCGMTADGTPYCWGYNSSGQLGDGSTTNASSPVAVADLTTVDRLWAGVSTTCAVVGTDAYCWGYNGAGALGDGTRTSRSTPTSVIGGISWSHVAPGNQVSCGASTDRTPYCWGYTPLVGDGSTLQQTTPDSVVGGITFTTVSAGGNTTCASTGTDGYCWGDNYNGQLGVGDLDPRTTPTQITTVGLEQIESGYNHACGLTAAGDAYCWGYNYNGQLGDGTTTNSEVPVAVNAGFTFSQIDVGGYHTCGIRASNGAAYCWGYNYSSQLGDGTTTSRSSPYPVAGGLAFAEISLGYYHTCGVATTGTTYCWGYNYYGQLGDGTNTNRTTPTAVAGGLGFVEVSTDNIHTCGRTVGNLAYCWGANYAGQLGDGTTSNHNTPTAVTGGVSFAVVDAGGNHSCGVSTTDAVYCWGSGGSGQLGNGSLTNQSAPTPIQGGYTMATVSAGGAHTCGITTGGATYCWGNASNGALGTGASIVSDPVAVAGGYTLPYTTFLVGTSGFRFPWGSPGLRGQAVRLTPEQLEAIRAEQEAAGLPVLESVTGADPELPQ